MSTHPLSDSWNANLVRDITDSAITIDLDNGEDGLKLDGDGNIAYPIFITIDSEQIEIESSVADGGGGGIDRFTASAAGRGANGTTAAAHTRDTAIVRMRILAEHFDEVQGVSDAGAQLVFQMLGGDNSTTRLMLPIAYNGGSGGTFMKVIAQAAPDMTVVYKTGAGFVLGTTVVRRLDATSALMVAPVGNPRIDIVEIDADGVWSIVTGAEAGSPSAPSPTAGSVVDAEIFHRVGTVHIDDVDDSSNSYITDKRLAR